MMNLNEYLKDGACMQAVCVMAYVRSNYDYIINESYDEKYHDKYHASLEVSRYCNCREQGYTYCLRYKGVPVVYVTNYEHRNCDSQVVVINRDKYFSDCPSPIEVMGDRKGKWDYDKDFDCMKIEECGEFIVNILIEELHNAIEKEKEGRKKDMDSDEVCITEKYGDFI